MNETVQGFRGEFEFLSNFYEGYPVTIDGVKFRCREGAFQAAKAVSGQDLHMALCLSHRLAQPFTGLHGGAAKRLGRAVHMNPEWHVIRDDVMYEINKACIQQNPEFAEKLLATGDIRIVEYNDWRDTYWGVCHGVGANAMGRILMRLRDELREGCL